MEAGNASGGGDDPGIDIESLLSGSSGSDEGANSLEVLGLLDRQMAIEVARNTRVTTLVLIGNLVGPRCLPSRCEGMGGNFKLLSIRPAGRSSIAMFSVPVESEMAELFEEIDGRSGLHAIAYDAQGRPKEAYVL